ncbi:putative low-specificity L-threonine aldolase 2 [Arabidopsis thaliana]
MEIGAIEAAVRSPKGDLHHPVTKLICLETTQANCGGRCLPIEYTDKVGELAKKHGLKLHIDGARIFNASVALGVPVKRIVQAADSVSICLSKGIGAPVGSVIVGSKKFITKARWLRKTLGGGMRQIGVLCAAALVALHENVAKLEDDHKKARVLAEGLNRIERLRVNVAAVETNIIYVDIPEDPKFGAEEACKSLEDVGVLVIPQATFRIRIVLHHQISDVDVEYVLSCFEKIFHS